MDKHRVVFYGTPEFSVPTLQALVDSDLVDVVAVVTQPDRPAGRGKKLAESPVKQLAKKYDILVLQPESVRKEKDNFLNQLEELRPLDLAIVVAFGQILPLEVLDYPKANSVNIHASLLPRWRGAAPIHHAILAGDTQTGVGLMKMERGLDTGPVYIEERVGIKESDTLQTLHDKLAAAGAKLLACHISSIIAGDLTPQEQSAEGVTYAHKISPQDALIDWHLPAVEINRKIRAFNPFPGAFTSFDSQRLKIFAAIPRDLRPGCTLASPGSVVFRDKDSIEIQCQNDSVLLLQEVQIAGRKKMSVKEFLQGIEIEIGDMLA